MGMEEIQKICEYIRKNNPQAEDFTTIAAGEVGNIHDNIEKPDNGFNK